MNTRHNIAITYGMVSICLMMPASQGQAVEFSQTLKGDVGAGTYYMRSIIRSQNDSVSVLPYGDFNYGIAFARVDTLGIKTVKSGYGYLELAARISKDGFNTNTPELQGLHSRSTSVPLGIGTLQITPIGGFYINAFHDVNQSKGNQVEVQYGGKLDLPHVTLFPLLGIEYQSREYVRYYYGISTQEAANSQYMAYQPAGACNSYIGLIADVELTAQYHLNAYVRHKRLGSSIQDSPIVIQKYLDSAYLALSYRFK